MTTSCVSPCVVAIAGVLFASSGAAAQFSQGLAPNPGGYIQAAGTANDGSGAALPGQDLANAITSDPSNVFDGQFFTGIGNASATATFNNTDGVSTFASGSVVNGQIGLTATITRPNFIRAAGTISGGFNDSLTVSPSDTTFLGQQAFLLIDVIVSGTVEAAGGSGFAEAEVMMYKNGGTINDNALFDPGSLVNDLSGSSFQIATWQARTFDSGDTDSLTLVDEVATFSIPVTLGETFNVGMYARVDAGWRSTFNSTAFSTASAVFGNTFTWGGVSGAVLADGTPVDVSLSSASGIDFNGVVPAPGAAALLGLAGLAAGRRRR